MADYSNFLFAYIERLVTIDCGFKFTCQHLDFSLKQ